METMGIILTFIHILFLFVVYIDCLYKLYWIYYNNIVLSPSIEGTPGDLHKILNLFSFFTYSDFGLYPIGQNQCSSAHKTGNE